MLEITTGVRVDLAFSSSSATGSFTSRTSVVRSGGTKQELETLLKDDPFQVHGLADYTVTEFKAGKLNPALAEFA